MNMTTIAAIATPIGSGGIGIIRISGPLSIKIAKKLFIPFSKPSQTKAQPTNRESISFTPFRLHYGYIVDPKKNTKVDEVLIAFMKAPRSYTCEDVIEIHSHSNAWAMKHILELVILNGACLAEPGEFTKRAFLNGRIDLTQAEAISDIIAAKSEVALNAALTQLDGRLNEKVLSLIQEVDAVHSLLEATIDFYDETEEEDFLDPESLIQRLKSQVLAPVDQFINTHECTVYLKDGIKIAIAGQPNVGKSSLMNRLIDKDRSIVTDIPGTTRDIVQDQAMIRGIPVSLSDTAGIHQTEHPVEKIGIAKTHRHLKEADIVLFLVDAENPSHPENLNIFNSIKQKNVIVVVNKIDRIKGSLPEIINSEYGDLPRVYTSAKNNTGIESVKDTIEKQVAHSCPITPGQTILPNLRHHQVFLRVKELIQQAMDSLQNRLGGEVASIDLEEAQRQLKSVIGQFDRPDVLDSIFSQFCIGK